MHFGSPYTTMDDWSRQKSQAADNLFTTSLALPVQSIQSPITSSSIQDPSTTRSANSFMDGQIHDFTPYQQFQQFDDLTMNPLSTKSPSQSSTSPQSQHQPQQMHQQHTQQEQGHNPHSPYHYQRQQHAIQQQQHQQQHAIQQQQQQTIQHPSWADQRYQQGYMPVTSNSMSMGQPTYFSQHQQQVFHHPQQPQSPHHPQQQPLHQPRQSPQHHQQQSPHHRHQLPHHLQQPIHHHQQQHQQQQHQQHHQQQQQQHTQYHHQQQRALPQSQLMSYPHHHQQHQHQHQQQQMLSHQQDFLNSLNHHQQSVNRQPHYPGLLTQQLQPQQQSGRKRKDGNDYLIDGTVAAPTKKPKKKKKKTKTKEPEDPNAPPKPKRKTGLNKPLILSPALSALMDDESELSRPEIVKRLWKYIKGNDLQDPQDRRYILCDEKLRTIFHVERVNSFGMNRDLSQHLTKKEEVPGDQQSTPTTSEAATSTAATVPESLSSSSSVVLPTGDDATVANTIAIKHSPTVTADTPDDVVTPREGEHVHALTNNSSINSIINNATLTPSSGLPNPLNTSSTSLPTPLLH